MTDPDAAIEALATSVWPQMAASSHMQLHLFIQLMTNICRDKVILHHAWLFCCASCCRPGTLSVQTTLKWIQLCQVNQLLLHLVMVLREHIITLLVH